MKKGNNQTQENNHKFFIFHDEGPSYPIAKIDATTIKKAATVFVAIENKTRQKMLSLIKSKQPITVSEISETIKLEHSIVSRHLGILRRARIVKTAKEKKYAYYSIDEVRLVDIICEVSTQTLHF